jgi:nucleoside-diphosphate-sugar epimerase
MKYLVIGSDGKIGRHLVNLLKSNKEDVIGFDIKNGNEFDLRKNNTLLKELLDWADFVYFLAFDIGGSVYIQNNQHSFAHIHNNISIMKETFEQLKYFKKPFIFTSSEMADLRFSTYGLLKSIGDCYVKSMDSIITKLWNVYCIEPIRTEKSHAVNDFIYMAKKFNKITLRTNGKEERQLLYGSDCAECLYILSKKYDDIDRNKEIHISSFEWISMLDTANVVASLFNNAPVIPSNNTDPTHKNVKIDPNTYVLDFWKPKTSLINGIKEIITNIKE